MFLSPPPSTALAPQLDPDKWREHRFGLPAGRWGELRGKSIWVTGGGSGYGRCIALALVAAGAQVFISGRRREKLEQTHAHAVTMGVDAALCIPLCTDITRSEDVHRTAQSIAQHTRHLHGLVNNAAVPEPDAVPWPLADLAPPRWDALLAANVTGQWLTSKAALPLMASGPGFRVVFMSSGAGWSFTPGFGPYNVSKAAVNNLGASFAAECAARFPGKDVQINILVPGEARTEMNQGSTESPYSVVAMTLALLTHPAGGPNGCFFHRDGRHLAFADAAPYPRSLLEARPQPSGQRGAMRWTKGSQPAIEWLRRRLHRQP